MRGEEIDRGGCRRLLHLDGDVDDLADAVATEKGVFVIDRLHDVEAENAAAGDKGGCRAFGQKTARRWRRPR